MLEAFKAIGFIQAQCRPNITRFPRINGVAKNIVSCLLKHMAKRQFLETNKKSKIKILYKSYPTL